MNQEWLYKYQELESYIDQLCMPDKEKTIYHFIMLWALYNKAYVTEWAKNNPKPKCIEHESGRVNDFSEYKAVKEFFRNFADEYVRSTGSNISDGAPDNKVLDMRPEEIRPDDATASVLLRSETNGVTAKNFGLFIYQIRCNLFHGSKEVFQIDPDERDMEFIRWALRHLQQLAEYVRNANSTSELGR